MKQYVIMQAEDSNIDYLNDEFMVGEKFSNKQKAIKFFNQVKKEEDKCRRGKYYVQTILYKENNDAEGNCLEPDQVELETLWMFCGDTKKKIY